MAGLSLAVCAVIDPHDAPPQLTDQLTPSAWGSLATMAVI